VAGGKKSHQLIEPPLQLPIFSISSSIFEPNDIRNMRNHSTEAHAENHAEINVVGT